MGIMYPLYVDPTSTNLNGIYSDVMQAASNATTYVIIHPTYSNPYDAPCPPSADWQQATSDFASMGVKTLGYLPTFTGNRDLFAARECAEQLYYCYQVDGIYLGDAEMSSSKYDYYTNLTGHIRNIDISGTSKLPWEMGGTSLGIAMHGTATDSRFTNLTDVIFPYYDIKSLSAFNSYVSGGSVPSWVSGANTPEKFGAMVNAVPDIASATSTLASMASNGFGWAFLTDGATTSTSTPSFYTQLVADIKNNYSPPFTPPPTLSPTINPTRLPTESPTASPRSPTQSPTGSPLSFPHRVLATYTENKTAGDGSAQRGFYGDVNDVSTDFPTSLEFAEIPVSEILIGFNTYNWTLVDNYIQGAVSRGRQLVLKLYLMYPGRATGVPGWMIAFGVAMRDKTAQNAPTYESFVIPDWDNNLLVSSMEQLIAALGARIDGEPGLARVEVGMLGSRGDWWVEPLNSTFMANTLTRFRIMAAFHGAFKWTPLAVSDRELLLEYTMQPNDLNVSEVRMGFNDAQLGRDVDQGTYSCQNPSGFFPLMMQNNIPLGRMPNSAGIYPAMRSDVLATQARFDVMRTCVLQASISSVRYPELFSSSGALPAADRQYALELQREMGYHLVVTQVEALGNIHSSNCVGGDTCARIAITMRNTGRDRLHLPNTTLTVSIEGGLVGGANATSSIAGQPITGLTPSVGDVTYQVDLAWDSISPGGGGARNIVNRDGNVTLRIEVTSPLIPRGVSIKFSVNGAQPDGSLRVTLPLSSVATKATLAPTTAPSASPTTQPTSSPLTTAPTRTTLGPTECPTTAMPTSAPTKTTVGPTECPLTAMPTVAPTRSPSAPTTMNPTGTVTMSPTARTVAPTTANPSVAPTTMSPSSAPTSATKPTVSMTSVFADVSWTSLNTGQKVSFMNQFRLAIATAEGIPQSWITIMSVRAGSTIVESEITMTNTVDARAFITAVSSNATDVFRPANGFTFGRSSTSQAVLVSDSADGEATSSSSSTILIVVLVPVILVLVGLAVVVVIYNKRTKQRNAGQGILRVQPSKRGTELVPTSPSAPVKIVPADSSGADLL